MLDRTSYYAIYCWIASLSPIWDQKYPITGDEFLRRIQPWRELFSPRSVSARKFMAFWPAWAPRTAARSSMLAVLRAARTWPSDFSGTGFANTCKQRLLISCQRPFLLGCTGKKPKFGAFSQRQTRFFGVLPWPITVPVHHPFSLPARIKPCRPYNPTMPEEPRHALSNPDQK